MYVCKRVDSCSIPDKGYFLAFRLLQTEHKYSFFICIKKYNKQYVYVYCLFF